MTLSSRPQGHCTHIEYVVYSMYYPPPVTHVIDKKKDPIARILVEESADMNVRKKHGEVSLHTALGRFSR